MKAYVIVHRPHIKVGIRRPRSTCNFHTHILTTYIRYMNLDVGSDLMAPTSAIAYSLYNIDRNIILKIKTCKRTKGYDLTLVKGQSRLAVRKYSFSHGIINQWNKLSANCVHSSTVTLRYNAVVGRHLLQPPYKRGAL